MEADWSAEIGADLPVIVVPWEHFIDLRLHPEAAATLQEIAQHPALALALQRLNAPGSPLLTAKCDVWTLTTDEIDPMEFDAATEDAQAGLSSYIDLIACDPSLFDSFELHREWATALAHILRNAPQPCGLVDAVIRPAHAAIGSLHGEGFGITLYCAGCGADAASATDAWQSVLETAVAATMSAGISSAGGPGSATSPRQRHHSGE
ncbi:hypothetical protein [Paracidobacterium acidisoli]|uniref:Uncharacterized protein n=1 Tax=Paracidobacterium acidisoli TaxID=2303751 RepID=A0A372IQN7_9BACT|nr:hypothetical protein [Paracidobacterium acidisoli]MBT9331570.1 hypothetical protein [Paracidobacterium acidisoli]